MEIKFIRFENHLREVRARRRMTQLRLSLETSIPQTRISLYENGFFRPNPDERERMADALEVSVEELFPEKR